MAERKGSVRIEGTGVSIRVRYQPYCAEGIVTKWFDFRGGLPLDPSIYSIPREDGIALGRALRNIRRFKRTHQLNEAETALLDLIQSNITSAHRSRKLWPEDF